MKEGAPAWQRVEVSDPVKEGGDISMGRRGEEHSHCEGIEGVRGVGGHPSSLYAPFASISPISITETHPWHKSTLFHDLQTGIALPHTN